MTNLELPQRWGSPESLSAHLTRQAYGDGDVTPVRSFDQILVDLAVQAGRATTTVEILQLGRDRLQEAFPSAAVVVAPSGPARTGRSTRRRRPHHRPLRTATVYTDQHRLEHDLPEIARRLPIGAFPACVTVVVSGGGHEYGALGLGWADSDGPEPALLDVIDTVGTLVSQAVQHVEATAREHEIARHLQRSLLPVLLPIAGLEIEERYEPAGQDALAGGDFYDAVPLGDGRTALLIGDVAGHGEAAAAASGEVRYIVRGVLEHTQEPSAVLCRVESALGRGGRAPTMVTLLCAVLDERNDCVHVASAGHLPLLLRRAGGQVIRATVAPAPPLGAGLVSRSGPPAQATYAFHPGDVLVLYTDGLVERRDRPIGDVLAQVEASVRMVHDPSDLCGDLARFAADNRDHDDDVALLVVRRI